MDRLAKDKNTCLLQKFVNYECKKFYNMGPGLTFMGRLQRCLSERSLFLNENFGVNLLFCKL
jgi:hypothetical protein